MSAPAKGEMGPRLHKLRRYERAKFGTILPATAGGGVSGVVIPALEADLGLDMIWLGSQQFHILEFGE